ncbi:MAG: hypothetical protein MK086_09675 [Flavobacteriales bacterium]|nr:hypothetical protein [Flavobacteriales bacterium]
MPKRVSLCLLLVLLSLSDSGYGQLSLYENEKKYSSNERTFPSVRTNWFENFPVESKSLFLDSFGKGFFQIPDSDNISFSLLPLVNIEGGYSSIDGGVFETSAGFTIKANLKKFTVVADLWAGVLDQPGYLQDFSDSLGVIASRGRVEELSNGGSFYIMPSLAVSFKPNEIFNFQLGYGKNFFGNGHRSLFLSDVAYNYPYLRIDTDVWRIKYINLFSALKDISADPYDPRKYRDKFSSTHYFNWAVSPRFNVGLFETIIWQASDTLSDRGFDPNYLNPIIFYRPVEFSIGSPDNAIIGLDLSYKLTRSTIIYGQLVFDEFLLSEFRARDGWWGNKWGAQFGFKALGAFGLENSFLRTEFSLARPFTYTHGSVLQNFGHYNQPLAHPLGTNFYEGLVHAYYQKRDYFFEGQWNYSVYGRDVDSLNLGGNIYRSYANPAEVYGNQIAQGHRSTVLYQRLSAGIILNRNLNLRASIYYVLRDLNEENSSSKTEHLFGIRLATELYRTYTDF